MGLEDCPLCLHGYHQLSQHLRVTHKVINSQERKLLLAISSGRVDVRKGTCPVPSCGKSTSRMDRHLKDHTELTRVAQQETMQVLKRRKIIHDLTELRASNPAMPMASTLDLEEAQNLEDAPPPPEEGTCDKPCCQHTRKQLQDQVAELNRQVDTLSSALRDVTRCYRLLRRPRSTPSTEVDRVTRKLLTSLHSPEKEVEATAMEKSLRRKLVMHEVALNQAKEGCLISKAVLKECRSSAKRKIPEILGKFLLHLTSQTVAPQKSPLIVLLFFVQLASGSRGTRRTSGHFTDTSLHTWLASMAIAVGCSRK